MAAEAVVFMALGTLGDLLSEEVRFLSCVSSEVKALHTQLKEMRCLLEDADKQRHQNKTVGNWISEIKDLAYRAEDAIETYAVQVSSNRGQFLRRFSCIMNECFSLHQIGSDISQIKSELERVTKSMQEYGISSIIRHGEGSSGNHDWRRQTFPHEFEDCFLGKDDELDNLVSLTLDAEQQRVVSIWGMGGIGKTTIARKVYNHIEIKRSFESFAWVCITQQCQIRPVWEDVLKQLNPELKKEDITGLSNTELIGQLCQIQTAKRCLIVLDDVWEIDHWDGLMHAFLIQGLKSKILLTTRKRKLADMGLPFELGLLNIDHGWELLQNKASPRTNFPDFEWEEMFFQKMGKEMVHKCGYLPLAISLLGGVLRKKHSRREWELVNENVNAYLYKVDDIDKEKEIHGVFNLSYEDLPYYLKPCFLYMGQFKEDQVIHTTNLYRMWIAMGMISHENRGNEATLMDIAELYLSELASRCIVQVQVEDSIPAGMKYRSCRLHDVVRELCLSIGKREDFGLQILDYQGRGRFSTLLYESLLSTKTRHLVIRFEREMRLMNHDDEISVVTDIKDTGKHLRSLQFLSDFKGIEFPQSILDFQKFKLLKVLVFVGFSFEGRKLPRGIGNLTHLRLLCLEECELDEVPSSISTFPFLHTLDLAVSRNIRVPNVLRKMTRLRNLILPIYDEKVIGNYRLRLDEGLDKLEALVGVNSLVHEFKSFSRMKNLRRFYATVYDNKSLSVIVDSITTNWSDLQYCGIEIRQGCQFTTSSGGVLMDFKKVLGCPSLHDLRISCVRLGRVLEECANQVVASKLVFLTLSECEIEDDPMELLGKLPFLQQLLLLKRSFVGKVMMCHASGFCRLKWLVLDGLPNLVQWRVEEGAMPIISQLEINNCPHLEMVISDGPEEDFDKIRHVPSVVIYQSQLIRLSNILKGGSDYRSLRFCG